MITVTFCPNAIGRIAAIQLSWEDLDTRQVTKIAPEIARRLWRCNFNTWDLAQRFEQAYQISFLLWDDTEVTEFASLVSRASQR